LEALGVTLWAVDGKHPTTHAAARELGLESSLHSVGQQAPLAEQEIGWEEAVGIVVKRTLRSGQAIHHAGHVTLVGDVNPGAEIVATGNIIVWGRLRGIAHAGVPDNEQAIVCALELAPSQIRIGSHIARPPERSRTPKVPEVASVQEDQIVVEGWNKGGWSFEVGGLRLEFGT
jgi:septum site-determining protein MinC